jgi:DNA-binding transcriptional LysR family regulator
MESMEDHRLKAFCLVVELRSFSKAAGEKFMTQSAMSHLIRNLEDELGVRLLSRRGKTVVPTRAGRMFYRHAKQILGNYKNMENDIYAISRQVRGPLDIGASPTVAACLLPQVFYDFHKLFREVHIDLSVSKTGRVVSDLLEGRIEIGIVEGSIKNPEVFSEEIAEDEIVIIASDEHPLARKKSVTPSDLQSQPFIMPEPGSGIREFIDDFFHAVKIHPDRINVLMTLGSTELIIQMVKSGLGISFVSKWSVFGAVKEGSIRLLPLGRKELRRKFYLITADEEPSTQSVKAFREFVRNYRLFIPF